MPMDEKKALDLLEKIDQKVDKNLQELWDAVEAQGQEMRSRGGGTPETNEKVESLEQRLQEFSEAQKEIQELAPQLQEMRQNADRPGGVGHKGRVAPGKKFADSDEYKNLMENRENKSRPVELGAMENILPERKMLTSDETGWGGAGLLIEPQLLPGILTEPQREIRFRDLVNVQQVTTDSVRFFKETGFANIYTSVTANVAAAATVIPVESVAGMFAGQAIQIGAASHVIASVQSANSTITLTAGLAAAISSGADVISDHIGGTPHGGRKPQASIQFDDEVTSIITIAHWIAAHRQTLEDAPQLEGMINSRLLYGLDMALEHQALYGTGTSTTLLGIFNHPNVQDQGTRTGTDPNGNPWTPIDWMRKALTKAMVAEYPVNGFLVNPLNWEAIELAKDSQGRYLWITVTEGGVRRIFAVPVAVTTAVRAGEFLTGAFGLGVTLFDRQQANIRVSDSHAEFFVQNALAILAELRAGLAVIRPESLVKGKF